MKQRCSLKNKVFNAAFCSSFNVKMQSSFDKTATIVAPMLVTLEATIIYNP